MKIVDLLAHAQGRKDEQVNLDLAEKLAKKKHTEGTAELVGLLETGTKPIRHNAIKVLYEIGNRDATLLKPHVEVFFSLITSKDNRLQWGAMTALAELTSEVPEVLYHRLPMILESAERGSVITRDQAVRIILKLYAGNYADQVFPLLLEVMNSCPDNQLPMYAEWALEDLHKVHGKQMIELLGSRVPSIEKESKVKRIQKVISKLEKRQSAG